MPGGCHHAGVAQAKPASAALPCHPRSEAPPCHAGADVPPSHGGAHDMPVGDGCDCGCCHLAAAMITVGLVDLTTSHEAALASQLPSDLSYIPPPTDRPPISRPA